MSATWRFRADPDCLADHEEVRVQAARGDDEALFAEPDMGENFDFEDGAERLIGGLLLLARSEPEVTERSYVDLADIVEHVVSQLPADSVSVRAELEPAPTTGNAVLLERLLQNLVENGVRHNLPEDGWVRVTTGTHPDGWVTVEVSNTGPVVPRYEIPHLFEPFRRLRDERLAAPGAGLGLSIVQAIAHAHGGEVHAEPRGGGGLTVTVKLPIGDPVVSSDLA